MIIIPDILATNCKKCGAKVSPGYDFCLSCGTKFSELAPRKQRRDMYYGESNIFRFLYPYGCIVIILVGIIAFLYLVSFYVL